MGFVQFKNSLMLAAAVMAVSATASADIKWSGDLRYRFSQISTNTGAAGASDVGNTSQQSRARLVADGMIDEQWSGKIRFSTVGNVFNAGTANIDGAGRKTNSFDIIKMVYKPMADLSITFGQDVNAMWQAANHEMNFGLDTTYSGWTIQWQTAAGPVTPYVRAGYYTLVEAAAGDAFLGEAQVGVKWVNDNMNANVAYGMYQTNSMVGKNVTTIGVNGQASTQMMTAGVFSKEYKVSDIEAEFGMVTGLPWTLYAGVVSNSESSGENNASIFGVRLGQLKEVGSWQLSIDQRDVKRDANMYWFGDATFGGGPATYEAKGSKLTASYKFTSNLNGTFWYHMAKTGSVANGVEAKHDRMYAQLDLSF